MTSSSGVPNIAAQSAEQPNGIAAIAVAAGIAAGGSLAGVSMFWPWTANGVASTVPGHRLAGLLLDGTTVAWVPRWTGFVLFSIPMMGFVAALLAFVERRSARSVRRVLVVLFTVMSVGLLYSLRAREIHKVGFGGWCAVVGGVIAIVGEGIAFRSSKGSQ